VTGYELALLALLAISLFGAMWAVPAGARDCPSKPHRGDSEPGCPR
jgi:hypothetical protein